MQIATSPIQPTLAELRRLIARDTGVGEARPALPFGVAAIDRALPGGGLALGAVHQICESGPRGSYGAMAMLFAGGVLARLSGPVLWCLHRRDLFAPALARVGLHPDRVIYCETWKDAEILPAMEEGLRHRGLAGVVGELTRLALIPSRRLQLAAEASGVTVMVVSRAGSADVPEANAAFARWCVSAVPSDRGDALAMGRPRWRVELQRCRGAAPNTWIVEACDAQGRLALPAGVGDRPHAQTGIANLIVWPSLFESHRRIILGSQLLACRGRVQRATGVVHLIAEGLTDRSALLRQIGGKDEGFTVPAGRGDEAKHGGGPDAREPLPLAAARDIFIPDRRLGEGIDVKTRNFR